MIEMVQLGRYKAVKLRQTGPFKPNRRLRGLQPLSETVRVPNVYGFVITVYTYMCAALEGRGPKRKGDGFGLTSAGEPRHRVQ